MVLANGTFSGLAAYCAFENPAAGVATGVTYVILHYEHV